MIPRDPLDLPEPRADEAVPTEPQAPAWTPEAGASAEPPVPQQPVDPGASPEAGVPIADVNGVESAWELVSALDAVDPLAAAYTHTPRVVPITLRGILEPTPGERWRAVFEERWPAYESWFLREGDEARASYATSIRMLREHLPEIVPVYEQLVELAGGGDLAARMLSMVQPPPYLAGCSQAVWSRERPMLVRNYDYLPDRFDGLIWSTAWTGRRVLGTGDSLWGLLDGINDAGLAVSLTFGGRRVVGAGFGIPLIVRYLLETCTSVGEVRAVLERVPIHLAHNLTILDAAGAYLTAYLAPDRRPVFRDVPMATNHQDLIDWPEYTAATGSIDREVMIEALLADPHATGEHLVDAFLRPPLRDAAGAGHFGTLYTAVLHPLEERVEYRWPTFSWHQSFDAFDEGSHTELVAAERRRIPRPGPEAADTP